MPNHFGVAMTFQQVMDLFDKAYQRDPSPVGRSWQHQSTFQKFVAIVACLAQQQTIRQLSRRILFRPLGRAEQLRKYATDEWYTRIDLSTHCKHVSVK